MSPSEGPRPGGRSARVQQSVHAAVRALQVERGRHEITVPLVAARAGVTASTVYRRWGDLTELLADVAAERLRPETPPAGTGSLRGDLAAYCEQYLEETSSPTGRAFLRDLVASCGDDRPACCCDLYIRKQIGVIVERAARRGEPAPGVGEIVEGVMAPMMYRILFVADPVDLADARRLVDALLARGGQPRG
ncbi:MULTISPECIES: TetR/AcrR family transcriptional regulator [unclassified Frankia]